MNAARTPFATRPTKPQVTRLPDGRIGIFIGSAYQFTDDAGARSLYDQLGDLLVPDNKRDPLSARAMYEQNDRQFTALLQRELEAVECGGCAPTVMVSKVSP